MAALGLGLGLPKHSSYTLGKSFDPDYQAVLDYAVANAIALPAADVQQFGSELITDLRSANLWSKTTFLFNFGVGSGASDFGFIEQKTVLNTYLIAVNSPTYVPTKGWRGNGTSSYITFNSGATTGNNQAIFLLIFEPINVANRNYLGSTPTATSFRVSGVGTSLATHQAATQWGQPQVSTAAKSVTIPFVAGFNADGTTHTSYLEDIKASAARTVSAGAGSSMSFFANGGVGPNSSGVAIAIGLTDASDADRDALVTILKAYYSKMNP